MPTVSSQNYTGLYGAGGSVTPGTGYGNANVVGLLAAGTDGANTVGNIDASGTITAAAVDVSGNVLAGNATATTFNGNLVGGTVSASTISATGNIVTDGYFVGNFAGNITGNIAVTGSNTQVLFNNAGNVGASADFTFNDATNVMSVAGNVSANYYVGNGSLLTGVATSLPSATTDQYLRYNGSAWAAATLQLENDPSPDLGGDMGGNNHDIANVGNIQVNGTYTGSGGGISNINGANVNGTVSSANVAGTVLGNAQANITSVGVLTSLSVSGNVQGGNIRTAGQVSATGNVQGNYFIGDGSQLTGLPATYGNSNVTTLLAGFGSNAISTTGNVTASYFAGDGSLLTNLPGGSYGNSNVSALLAAFGSNTISSTGNITTTANIAGDYILGNGSLLTGIAASYGNANVADFLAAFGSNAMSTTGNVTSGNFLTSGVVSATGNVRGGNLNTGGNVNIEGQGINVPGGFVNATNHIAFAGAGVAFGSYNTGNTAGNALVYADGANGVIQLYSPPTGNDGWIFNSGTGNLTLPGNTSAINYANGTSILSGIGAGGSNTQLQFNDSGVFAGNAAMTFDKTTGNITTGNIVTKASQINTVAQQGVVIPTTAISNARIVIGNGWQGNISTTYDGPLGGRIRNSRTAIWDYGTTGNSATQTELAVLSSLELTSNNSNTSSRINGSSTVLQIGGGTSAYNITANHPLAFVASQNQFLVGTSGNAAVGNTQIYSPIGVGGGVTVNAGGYANSAIGFQAVHIVNTTGNIGNAVMYSASGLALGSGTVGNVAVYYVPPFTGNSLATGSFGGAFRTGTSYYGLRVDDDLAQAKLGSLRQYHEYEYQIPTTSGNVTIDKTNGQVQVLGPLTGNVTITDYTNFVTTAYVNGVIAEPFQSDTVTLIINQGVSTGYTVTLPSSATTGQVYYAGNVRTVDSTANTVSMVSVTGARLWATGAAPAGRGSIAYLSTVSPGFYS